jgi:hypothetical protein
MSASQQPSSKEAQELERANSDHFWAFYLLLFGPPAAIPLRDPEYAHPSGQLQKLGL